MTQATATEWQPSPDPRKRAFDWAITELWYWINNDYAAKTTDNRADIRAIEDTWAEIAERLEQWRDVPAAAPEGGE